MLNPEAEMFFPQSHLTFSYNQPLPWPLTTPPAVPWQYPSREMFFPQSHLAFSYNRPLTWPLTTPPAAPLQYPALEFMRPFEPHLLDASTPFFPKVNYCTLKALQPQPYSGQPPLFPLAATAEVTPVKSSIPMRVKDIRSLGPPPPRRGGCKAQIPRPIRKVSNTGVVWMPKKSKSEVEAGFNSGPAFSPPPTAEVSDSQNCRKTTVMIRNIPNQFRRKMLVEFLDQICEQQNTLNKFQNHRFEYDFVYLPMDFWKGDNLGYAFVNFTSSIVASKIGELLHHHKWQVFMDCSGVPWESKKICEVSYARIQGKEELTKHFRNSKFLCRDEEYLPASFSTPRDGTKSVAASLAVVGKCFSAISVGAGTRKARLQRLHRERGSTGPH